MRSPRIVRGGEASPGAIGYRSAGTAEFLVAEDGRFYFLELNARIQFEHPVTEAVTGRDLVADQIRIAEGHTLEPGDGVRGHAIEVRLYAEDPLTFLPQAGKVERLRLPSNILVDAGVEEGDRIVTRYDPLIAKLIASRSNHDEGDRPSAGRPRRDRRRRSRDEPPFLRWLVAHPALRRRRRPTSSRASRRSLPHRCGPRRRSARRPFRLSLPTPAVEPRRSARPEHGHSGGRTTRSRLPCRGRCIRVVEAGQEGQGARDTLVVVEAMKMEMPLPAPRAPA